MEALILTCGTGGGHNSAANAIFEEMRKRGINAEKINPYTLKSERLADFIDNSYISTVRNAPKVFGAVYTIADSYRKLPVRSPVYFANKIINSVMQEYLSKRHFDIIVSTHFCGAEILTNMKNHGIDIPKNIFVATDYVCTPFTEETKCDAYVIPTVDLTKEFSGKGIPEEKIYPFGIPVLSSFSKNETRNEVKARLGLDINKKYILITGGSMGGGKIGKAIDKIRNYFAPKDDVELIIVCGSNQSLYKTLSEAGTSGMTVIGHTNDMASYIKASHLFITKPGGLSSTEAAVCGVPVLHTAPIPGCETYNAEYFSERNMSISGDITTQILHKLENLLNDELRCKKMIENQKRFINSNAASDICDLAEKLASHS